MIDVTRLTKKYRSLFAVEEASFHIETGEVVGFLGPNGAGKTTTMKMLACFIPPTSGTASVSGHDILREPLQVRRLIGYLPESTPLYPEMSPRSYLTFIGRARGLDRATLKQRMSYVVGVTGLEKVLLKEVSELSKGFRQRLCLAQALLHDPPFLVLDEPTTGLDPLQRIEIRDLIKSIGSSKTVILSTHILPEAEATCGRLIVIHKGKIVADGSSEQLVADHGKGGHYQMVVRADKAAVEQVLTGHAAVSACSFEGKTGGSMVKFAVHMRAVGLAGGEALYGIARENGWSLAELAYVRVTLEDVFRTLTGGSSETKEAV
ncbi:MAG: ATP-binding cassette domain-containing protein [Candidatus Brocadiia bacterium]